MVYAYFGVIIKNLYYILFFIIFLNIFFSSTNCDVYEFLDDWGICCDTKDIDDPSTKIIEGEYVSE